MLERKTVFVLGAGSSAEVRMPVGAKLKDIIATKLRIDVDPYAVNSGDRYVLEAYRSLANLHRDPFNIQRLHASGLKISSAMVQAESIDNFLEAHSSDSHIVAAGKLAIVSAILEAERKCTLFQDRQAGKAFDLGKVSDTWFMRLQAVLFRSVTVENVDQLFHNTSFINFNYDRCLEQFLFHAISNYYLVSSERAAQIVNTATIIHPYGTVGALHWQERSGRSISFGREARGEDLVELAQGIRTFSERVDDERALLNIQNEIAGANLVVFLGFAYHPLNVKLIAARDVTRSKTILGSALGISSYNKNVIQNEIAAALSGDITPNILLDNDCNCAKFMDDYSRRII